MEKEMEMYEDLLLSTGGGISASLVKSAQQGDPTIIIALGGTGIEALKVVKKKVYEQLKPDDPEATIPEYKNIRFLAVDTDKIEKGGKEFYHLNDEECLNISVPNLKIKMKADIEKKQAEFAWLQPEMNLLREKGAGTVRQVGRYCLFKNMDKISAKILELKRIVTTDSKVSKVNVHILAGISGGTGSGTFIDMCYIVRDLIGESATLFGYFFMPDVNLNKKEIVGDHLLSNRIKNNGYAALKELDYTMNLGCEGKTFAQYYGGEQTYLLKETAEPLVDLCHLISATDKTGNPITNGYAYSMNVVGEYILSYLAEVESGEGDKADQIQTLEGHLSNVNRLVGEIKKKHGENLNYHILGASTTELPTKEIGTYLAAKLYQKIGSGLTENAPTYNDVEMHAKEMGLTLYEITESLRGDKEWRVTGPDAIRWQGRYDFSIEDACDTTVSVTGGTIELTMPDTILDPIRAWKNNNSGILEKNFKALTKDLDDFKLIDKGVKADTLVSSVFQYLQNEVVANFEYGAVYAAKLTYNNHAKSLNDYLDGLITTANATASGARRDLKLRLDAIEAAVVECKKNAKKKPKKHVEPMERYKAAIKAYYQNLLEIEIMEKTVEMIAILKKQINLEGYKNSLYPMYFGPLESMLIKLKTTFESNLAYLLNSDIKEMKDDIFVWKMVKFKDIQTCVDSKFDEAIQDDSTEYKNFIMKIMMQYEKWFAGSGTREDNVVNMISSYMGEEFKKLLTASMESYLSDKYEIYNNPARLQEKIKKEIFANGVLAKAEPKFYIGQGYADKIVVKKHYLSVPNTEVNICNVAKTMKKIDVRITGLNDRIFAVKFESGIPLYAYGLIDKLEQQYKMGGTGTIGRHLYEITDRNKELNWSKLQSFIPYSLKPSACEDGKEIEKLYHDAVSRGIISENKDNPDAAYRVYELNKADIKNENDFMKDGTLDMSAIKAYVAKLKSYTNSEGKLDTTPAPDGNNNANIKAVKSLVNDGIKVDGAEDFTETCRIDYFIRFRGLQDVVRESLKILDDVDEAIKEATKWQNKGAEREGTIKLITAALCFELLKAEIGKYTYNGVDLWSGTMEYSKFPVYQIYKTFSSDAFTDAARKALENDVHNKLNALEATDVEKVEKVKAKYIDSANTGFINVMQQAAVLPESGDIETVYKLFNGEVQALLNLFAM